MRSNFLTALFLLAGTVMTSLASPLAPLNISSASGAIRCPSELSPEHRLSAEAHFREAKAQADQRVDLKDAPPIPVFWNVIYASASYEGGLLTADDVQTQINVLNQDYSLSGLSFDLQNISYIQNPDWFESLSPGTQMEIDMKEELRQGDAQTLNVYSVGFFDDGLLGFATFPYDYEGAPLMDGIVIKWDSLPNGASLNYNLGKTLTHETGHWVGLFHTFSGGCEETDGGDMISDTPAQAESTKGCPVLSNYSCVDPAGPDAIHNYMDYSDDICLTDFTPGQIERMTDQMNVYRFGAVEGSVGGGVEGSVGGNGTDPGPDAPVTTETEHPPACAPVTGSGAAAMQSLAEYLTCRISLIFGL